MVDAARVADEVVFVRRYLWIFISLVLPFAFWYMMKTRPPQGPGEVKSSTYGTTAEGQVSGEGVEASP